MTTRKRPKGLRRKALRRIYGAIQRQYQLAYTRKRDRHNGAMSRKPSVTPAAVVVKPKKLTRAERAVLNKQEHADMLKAVRREEALKKKALPKLKAPPQHPLMLKGNLEWDRPKVFDIICERIASSTDSLTTILKSGHEGLTLPGYSLVQRWLSTDKACAAAYAQAKEAQAEFMGEEIVGIAEDGRNDYMERFDRDGMSLGWFLNGEHVQRSRLRIDTRKWLMGKLKPRRFGEKLQVGGDPDGVPLQLQSIDLSKLTEEELLALKAARQKLLGDQE